MQRLGVAIDLRLQLLDLFLGRLAGLDRQVEPLAGQFPQLFQVGDRLGRLVCQHGVFGSLGREEVFLFLFQPGVHLLEVLARLLKLLLLLDQFLLQLLELFAVGFVGRSNRAIRRPANRPGPRDLPIPTLSSPPAAGPLWPTLRRPAAPEGKT